MQRARLDAIGQLNRDRFAVTADAEIEARIASYELAFRMQSAAPELLDFSKETPATLEMYGVNKEPSHPYAVNCLLARRMVERGVRFVLVSHGSWDDHNDIDKNLKKNCDDHGQAWRRPFEGPEAAWAARFDPRDLGGRIRPHSDDTAATRRHRLWPGPSSELLQHVDGRRRSPQRPSDWAAPTNSDCRALRIVCPLTTCKPPFFIC